MNIWLASGSPRRKQLLEWSGYHCDVHPKDIDESLHINEAPIEYALRLAEEKSSGCPHDAVVLAADTIVHMQDTVFGKPVHRADALRILETLSGHWHIVTTSVCIRHGIEKHLFATHTRVRLRELTATEIANYVSSGEADDKAGAYGIQGRAGAFVAEVQGSWTNVMGLPLEPVLKTLRGLSST